MYHVGTMELDYKALCDYASLSIDGKINILGIFQELNPSGFPCVVPNVFIVVSFKASPAEYEMEKSVKLVLVDPDGKQLLAAQGETIKIPRPRSPGSESRVNQIFGLQGIVVGRHGPYSFEILVDNDTKGHIALLVNDAPKQQGGLQ